VVARPASADDKTDVVVMNNGDRITCEIKELARGRLTVSTDPMDTVTVHWGDVVSVTSPKTFEVQVVSGNSFYGSLKPGGAGEIVVVGALGETSLKLLDVVRISPLNGGFWSRLDGSIGLGFNFAQASEQTQWTLNANAQYRRERYLTQGTLSSQFTAIEGADPTSRNSLTLSTRRFLGPRWFSAGFGQFQQDESLGLNFRSVLGGAGGRYLVQRASMTISVFTGAAYTREQFKGETPANSGEALLGADWEWFTLGNNDTDLSSTFLSYYDITGSSRRRTDFTTSYLQKIVKDLNWSLNLFQTYDSAPPAGQKSSDFGVSVSLGWSF
jgi:hypothetical protein